MKTPDFQWIGEDIELILPSSATVVQAVNGVTRVRIDHMTALILTGLLLKEFALIMADQQREAASGGPF